MSGTTVGFVIFAVMLALMVVRVPIGIAMFTVGVGGYLYLTGNLNGLLNSLKNLGYARLSNYDLVETRWATISTPARAVSSARAARSRASVTTSRAENESSKM